MGFQEPADVLQIGERMKRGELSFTKAIQALDCDATIES